MPCPICDKDHNHSHYWYKGEWVMAPHRMSLPGTIDWPSDIKMSDITRAMTYSKMTLSEIRTKFGDEYIPKESK